MCIRDSNSATTRSYEPLLREQIFANDNQVLPLPDSARIDKSGFRDALIADGFDVVTVTSSQIDSVSEFIEIADALSRKTRGRAPARPASFLDRHLQLRHELRAFHHQHFPLAPHSEKGEA